MKYGLPAQSPTPAQMQMSGALLSPARSLTLRDLARLLLRLQHPIQYCRCFGVATTLLPKDVCAIKHLLSTALGNLQLNRASRLSFNANKVGIGYNFNSLCFAYLLKRHRKRLDHSR